jgi:cyclomaltodextrinase / maltogenic alpha-amylase / neopullulanase
MTGWAATHLSSACAGLLLVNSSLNAAPSDHLAPFVKSSSNACTAQPYDGRALYLRGPFNNWNAIEAQKFTWLCNRFELVTALKGLHLFKIGDEGWSPDSDFGGTRPEGSQRGTVNAVNVPERMIPEARVSAALIAQGAAIQAEFTGVQRLTLQVPAPNKPILIMTDCPAPPPLGDTQLFLRGTINNWAALDSYAFQYSCDAYYLNTNLNGLQSFKIADAGWGSATTFGAGRGGRSTPAFGQALPLVCGTNAGGASDLSFIFGGEQTIKLAFDGVVPQITVGARSFADPSIPTVSNLIALSIRHDSRQLSDKEPFGAVASGTKIQFGVTAQTGISALSLIIEKRRLEGNQEVLDYNPVARVPMTRTPTVNGSSGDRWITAHTFSDIAIYGYSFEAEIDGKTYVYQNNTDAVYWTREKGSNGIGAVSDAPKDRKSVRRFRITVHKADFKVPDWAQDAVYYYIFPERFRNGDLSNDPDPNLVRYHDQKIELHKNWREKPYKPRTGDGSDELFNNDFFGGDLAGIIEKLDYIKALGANTIYLTPVFSAASNHKYDTADYKTIDPAFGSNGDFTRLTTEAAKRGIRVIPDASFNHTGSDSIYFDRFGNYRQGGAFEGGKVRADSPYSSWYTFDTTQKEPDAQYKGWVGVLDLPEINKSSTSFRKFAYGDADSVTRTWLNRGAAGWRMDVAPWVPDDFWREWRSAVKTTSPDALTIAETWFDAAKFFLGDTFDSTMNYIFRSAILDYANGGKAKALYASLELIRETYPAQAFYALMNLLSSHDQARALHLFGWQDDKADADAIAQAKQKLRLATFFQMTFPGAPAIYYGDEVGMTGGDDPFNRGTYPWADLGGKPDGALLADFKALTRLRNEHAVLRRGSIDAPIFIDDHVIVLLRKYEDTWAIVASNNQNAVRDLTVKLPKTMTATTFLNPLTGETTSVNRNKIRIKIPPQFGTALVSRSVEK